MHRSKNLFPASHPLVHMNQGCISGRQEGHGSESLMTTWFYWVSEAHTVGSDFEECRTTWGLTSLKHWWQFFRASKGASWNSTIAIWWHRYCPWFSFKVWSWHTSWPAEVGLICGVSKPSFDPLRQPHRPQDPGSRSDFQGEREVDPVAPEWLPMAHLGACLLL